MVTALFTVLLSMLVPTIEKSFSVAEGILCSRNLKQIGYAALSYSEDYAGKITYSRKTWWDESKPLSQNKSADNLYYILVKE